MRQRLSADDSLVVRLENLADVVDVQLSKEFAGWIREAARALKNEPASYEAICDSFGIVPVTYLPGLLITLVQACKSRRVFREGGLETVVKKALEAE